MAKFKNIYIYVSDALRYDHIPESIAEEGKVIPTLTPSGYTPISFSSLVTGKNPSKHNVRSFYDRLETENIFDHVENHCYYDHPEDAMCKNVFGNYTTSKELEDMEEPFLHIERALDTHAPYAGIKHGNEIPENPPQYDDINEGYSSGVESTEDHFWNHVEKLKGLGLYEDTLIIFTSDHGELLGEKKLFKERYYHNHPISKELNMVPTVFLNHEADYSHARTIDLIPTALALTEHEKLETEGLNLEKELPETGETMMDISGTPPLYTSCKWKFNTEWKPTTSKIKTNLGTLLKDLLEPIKDKIKSAGNSPVAHQ